MADRSRSRSPRKMPLETTPLTEADLITQNGNLRRQIERLEMENEGLKAELHSRKYFRVDALPENARAALDVVFKHDADPRVESQRQTIAAQAQRIADIYSMIAGFVCPDETKDSLIREKDEIIATLGEELETSEIEIDNREVMLALNDQQIGRLQREIAEKRAEITDLKQEVEHLEVELAGCSKCKGSASGTYGRLCEDCYFEEHSSQEEAS